MDRAQNPCDACGCPLDPCEAICPACGHWQRVETWYQGAERKIGAQPMCWVLLRLDVRSHPAAAGRWSVGRSVRPSFARAAALVAGHLRRPQALGVPDSDLTAQGYPIDPDRICRDALRQTACWDLLGGTQALTLSAGSAGVGFSATGGRAVAISRALTQAREMAGLCREGLPLRPHGGRAS